MIEIRDLRKSYKSKKGDVCRSVNDVSFELDNTGLIIILGDSGSGKTTLLNVMSGIDSFDEGSISIHGNKIEKMSQKQLDKLRRQDIAVVFQTYNLLEELNVYDNIAITLRLLNVGEEEIKNRVDEVLKKLGLEKLEKRNINELSGGQRQRVAIARAIIKKSKVIFMDEPTGNLDSENSDRIFEEVSRISKECLIVVVTHNKKMAYKYGDEIIQIRDGKVFSKEKNKKTIISKIKYYNNNGIEEDLNKNVSIEELLMEYVRVDKSKKKITLKLKVDYYKEDDKVEEEYRGVIESELSNQKMASLRLRDKIKLSLKVFKSKKKQLIYTGIILCIAFIMTVFNTYIYTYDYKKTIYMYLKDNNIVEMELNKRTNYINKLSENVENYTKKGKTIKENLEYCFSKENLEYYKEFDEVVSEDAFDNGVVVTSTDGLEGEIICGDYGENYDEVVISENLADSLYGKHNESIIDKNIVCDGIPVKVKGVCKNIDKNKEYEIKKYILANEKFFLNYKNVDKIGIEGGNLTKGNTLKTFISSYATYESLKNVKEKYLYKGRMPQKENEILISTSMIEEKDKYFEKGNEVLYKIRDIFTESNDAYGVINLFDYFPKGALVVGIMDSEQMEEDGIDNLADFFVCEEIYKRMLDDYSKYYWYDGIKYRGELTYNDLSYFEKKGIFIDEKGCEYIYNTNEWIKDMSRIIFFIDISIGILFIVSMLSYVYNIIKKNAKQIGILRSIGTPIKDIIYIYEQNSFILAIGCIILSYPVIKWMVKVINISMRKRFIGDTKIVMFQNNDLLMISCAGGFIIICFVLSLIPILQMSNKTPAKLLYEINK